MLYVKRNRLTAGPGVVPSAITYFFRRLLQSYAWPSAIIVDELDAGGFGRTADTRSLWRNWVENAARKLPSNLL